MQEIWKDTYHYLYEVSNMGKIRNKKTLKILKPITVKGYHVVTFRINGKTKQEKIHRLVAMAFIPNPNNLETVNHKDECKTNNSVQNLEWMSFKDNIQYGTRAKRAGKTNQSQISNNKKSVYCINLNKRFISINEASRELSLDPSNIIRCCKGVQKQHKGYSFKYVN